MTSAGGHGRPAGTGTTFKNIRLIDEDEEAIECGQGRNTVVLKTCFLKKA